MATVLIVDGPAKGGRFALEQHRLVMFGRDGNCTFQVLDPRMSRNHFQLRLDAATGRHTLIDFGSHNGVQLNGRRIAEESELSHGDEIRAGETTIIYSVDETEGALRNFEAGHRIGEAHLRTITDLPSGDGTTDAGAPQ